MSDDSRWYGQQKKNDWIGDGFGVETVLNRRGGETQCPYCSKWYKGIGQHWGKSDQCQKPPVSQKKLKMLRGLVLGDGCIHKRHGTVFVMSTNRLFIEWLDRQLGWLSTGAGLHRTAEQQSVGAKGRGSGGWSDDAQDYWDVYTLKTRRHPDLPSYETWYQDGVSVLPSGTELSPRALKMWYVSDGSLEWNDNGGRCCVSIHSHNSSYNYEYVVNLLDEYGFDLSHCQGNFRLLTESTEDFLNLIGKPVPGFGYKWCYESREDYNKMKTKSERVSRTRTVGDSDE